MASNRRIWLLFFVLLCPMAESAKADIGLSTSGSLGAFVTFNHPNQGVNPDWGFYYSYSGGFVWGDGNFFMVDNVNDTPVMRIFRSASNSDSFELRPDGDIGLANRTIWIERGQGHLGIGTIDPNQSIDIFDPVPRIRLNDDDTGTSAAMVFNGRQFALEGTSGQDVIRFDEDAPSDSLRITSSGPFNDVRVGMGTFPSHTLHMSSSVPTLALTDETNDSTAGLRFDANTLSFVGFDASATRRILSVRREAPSNSLVIDDAGNVGLGLLAPLAALNIFRDDGTARVLVEEISMDAVPRTLLRLASAGSNTKFEIDNTLAGVNWAFTNSGSDFRVSRQGSGQIEFRVFNNGDAFIAGDLDVGGDLFTNVLLPSDENLKNNLEALDPETILEKVAALPVTAWEYRDRPGERHIGPMAQDFRAAFGLGRDDRSISVVDASGVALASIQALNDKLEARNRELKRQNDDLAARVARLESIERENDELKERLSLVEDLVAQLLPRTAQN